MKKVAENFEKRKEIIGDKGQEKKIALKTSETGSESRRVIRVDRVEGEVIRGIKPENQVIRVLRKMTRRRKKPLLWEEVFLIHVYLFPLMGAVERYRNLNLNEYQGNKHRKSLLNRKLITLEAMPTPTGRLKLMVPTEQGFQWLKDRGFTAGASDKQGGILHNYWKRRLKQVFKKQEFSVKTEFSIGRKQSVDLMVSKGKRRIAIEIETGANPYEKIVGNIRKCFGFGFTKIVSFILDRAKAKRVRERVGGEKRVTVVSEGSLCIGAVREGLKGKMEPYNLSP